MAQEERTIYVYENWRGERPSLLGRLRCGFVRGQETFSFEYDPAWLASADSSGHVTHPFYSGTVELLDSLLKIGYP